MAENNTIMIVTVLAVIASLAAAGFSYYSFSHGPRISGFASTDTGTLSFTVLTEADIEFTDDTISWGSGRVDIDTVRAVLDTDAGTVTNGTWTPESSGFVLQNKGNTNVSMTIKVDKTPATFIGGAGGGGPAYEWLVSDGPSPTDTCAAHSGGIVNASQYNDTTTDYTKICNDMGYLASANEFNIDIRITIPYDSSLGALSDTITASAAASS